MAQTSMKTAPDACYEGMLASLVNQSTIASRAAYSSVFYGKAVALYAATEIAPGAQRVKLPAAATDVTGALFEGVAMADTTKPSTSNAYGEYVAKDPVPVIKKGAIWVVSADAVDDLTKGVYIRFQNGAATPAGVTNGAFRATTNADYALLPATKGKWIAGVTIGSVEFGLLELDL